MISTTRAYRRIYSRAAAAVLVVALATTAGFGESNKPETPAPVIENDVKLIDQVTGVFAHTDTGYVLNASTGLVNSNLIGFGGQYACRKYYPIEVIGTYRYSYGALLGQHIQSTLIGAGYVHRWDRYTPVLQASLGYARTASPDLMYLYQEPRSGFTTLLTAGLDVSVHNKIGIRPLFIENQYLPFGQIKSRYWTVGSGVFYRFQRPSLHRR